MFEIRLDERDLKAFRARLLRFGSNAEQALQRAVFRAGAGASNYIKESFRGLKSGRMYPVPRSQLSQARRRRYYQASAPSEAPAVASGNLRRNVGVQRLGLNSVLVIANAEYADRLEYEMNRPFMRPAFIRAQAELPKILEQELDKINV
jgi:hypothetical protein